MDFVCVEWGGMLREVGNFDKEPFPPPPPPIDLGWEPEWMGGERMGIAWIGNFEKVYCSGRKQHWNHFSLSFYSPGSWKPPCYLTVTFITPIATWIPASSISTGCQWALLLQFLLPHDLKPHFRCSGSESTFSSYPKYLLSLNPIIWLVVLSLLIPPIFVTPIPPPPALQIVQSFGLSRDSEVSVIRLRYCLLDLFCSFSSHCHCLIADCCLPLSVSVKNWGLHYLSWNFGGSSSLNEMCTCGIGLRC